MVGKKILQEIESLLGEEIVGKEPYGSIISTVSGKRYFFKRGYPSRTYVCEANGLKEIARTDTVATPKVIKTGEDYILTEYVVPGNRGTEFYPLLAQRLADMHRTVSDSFGFYEDNFIGANPQLNIPSGTECEDWATFYFNKRLLFQFRLAEKNRYISLELASDFIKFEKNIPELIKGSEEQPSLLHGDLWSGNYLCNADGVPVLIDPAVYYGHREAELAMTMLFGGFPMEFYDEYDKAYPLKSGWKIRIRIYKLYHLLNHLNLFGRSYLPESESIIRYYANMRRLKTT